MDPVEKLEFLVAKLRPSMVKGWFSDATDGLPRSWQTLEARSYVKRFGPENPQYRWVVAPSLTITSYLP